MGNCHSDIDEPKRKLQEKWVHEFVQYLNEKICEINNNELEHLCSLLTLLPTEHLWHIRSYYMKLPQDLKGNKSVVYQSIIIIKSRT